ncbi:multiple epidermal growth factor-like domains protein 10 isoform X2 [Ostrea edulis]|uniref:multiple epidermal growth factor-like domains protein 10 isoform X2 n=1 Tax=Ostrea edulis TaxID=37623 RepID=UPI0024AF0490|nr:multiple epidermal growth factor-like domains protein 10 isoform X2 [Ostrea edulis]
MVIFIYTFILCYVRILCILAQTCRNCGGDGSCNERSECNNGCTPGFFSLTCTLTCGQCAGSGRCDKTSGFCDERGCLAGFFGPLCTQACPIACGGDGSCDFTTANCLQGCSSGFSGSRCEIVCPMANCKEPCNMLNDGPCTSGCLNGFYGRTCDMRCNCEDGGACDQGTGGCVVSTFLTTPCMTGTGNRCESSQTATHSSPSVHTMMGKENVPINTGLLVGLSLSLAVLLILSVLILTLLYRYNKGYRKQKNQHVYEGPIIQQPQGVYNSLEPIPENEYIEISCDFTEGKDDGYSTVDQIQRRMSGDQGLARQ